MKLYHGDINPTNLMIDEKKRMFLIYTDKIRNDIRKAVELCSASMMHRTMEARHKLLKIYGQEFCEEEARAVLKILQMYSHEEQIVNEPETLVPILQDMELVNENESNDNFATITTTENLVREDSAVPEEDIPEILRLVEEDEKWFQEVIGENYDLLRINEAVESLRLGNNRGRILINFAV
jgi:hypothetical protein